MAILPRSLDGLDEGLIYGLAVRMIAMLAGLRQALAPALPIGVASLFLTDTNEPADLIE